MADNNSYQLNIEPAKTISTRKLKGQQAEQQARDFLLAHGLTFIESNYHCRYGEIDLIMQDKNILVFVEVRSRTPKGYGSAIETITPVKVNKIIKTAEHYLQAKQIAASIFCRFDVIAIDNKNNQDMVNWVPNAFDVGS